MLTVQILDWQKIFAGLFLILSCRKTVRFASPL